jgi:hypothetical protein
LDSAQLRKPYRKIPKYRYLRHPRRDLFDQFKPLPAYAIFERSKAGDVAARPRQAIDQTRADRVGDNREHDRHRAGRLLQCLNAWGGRSQNDVRPERQQFLGVSVKATGVARCPAIVDPNIAPV